MRTALARSPARSLTSSTLLALVMACSRGHSDPSGASLEQQTVAVERARAALATHLGRAVLANACGAAPALPPRNLLVVALTAEQCLSCRSVGFFMRELLRRERLAANAERVVVVTPFADVSDLCTYFERERTRVPVVGAAAMLFPDSAITTDVLVFRIDSGGTAGEAYRAREPKDLLPVLARDAPAAGEGTQVTSQPPVRNLR